MSKDRPKWIAASQLAFGVQKDRVVVPDNFLDVPCGREISSFLEKRHLWSQRPRGDILYIDRSGGEVFSLDPNNWQKVLNEKSFDPRDKFSGAILVTDKFLDFDSNDSLGLSKLSDHLRYRSPVYVFEKSLEVQKDFRLELMQGVGFVERKVLVAKLPTFSVWEARMETKRVVHAIDLLDKEARPKSHNYATILWKRMQEDYKSKGFRIKNPKDSEILKVLHASKNPPYDFFRLKSGWGVRLISLGCMCEYEIDMKGNEVRIYYCKEETHHLL